MLQDVIATRRRRLRLITALLVLVLDPLAVLLTLAAARPHS
jgi:hypothetical protein